MTITALLDRLAADGATLTADGCHLRYRGPSLDPPVRQALEAFRLEVRWLLAVGRLCVFCPRMLAEGDPICCPEHRRQLDATAMPWELTASGRAA